MAQVPTVWNSNGQNRSRSLKRLSARSAGMVALDADNLLFATGKTSVKGKNLLRDPHLMISVDDERAPFAFVLITEGTSAVGDSNPSRYGSTTQADAYGKRNAVDGELKPMELSPESPQ